MTTQVWRLVKTRYAPSAFDGEGARAYGSRWTSVGTRVAFASSNAALAVLEVLVHLGSMPSVPAYSLIEAMLPDDLIENLDESLLTDGWDASPVPGFVQSIGDAWVRNETALALRVPSALVPGGINLLINPAHQDFHHVAIVSVAPFTFDRRLVR